ncbi:unnamed protein product, partial [Rhizoctonia solani]
DEATRTKKRKLIQPALFHLPFNYRSHSGIVACASSLVELISKLFPNSIDKLGRETGLIGGPRPVFFSGWENSSIPIARFIRGQEGDKAKLGANQVILVRNDASRDALRARVGEIGLILTLYETPHFTPKSPDGILAVSWSKMPGYRQDSVRSARTAPGQCQNRYNKLIILRCKRMPG